GLIFIGATADNYLRAFDENTGEKLWQVRLPAGGQATPMSYKVDGRQYIVIAAGGHGGLDTKSGDYLMAYALPSRAAHQTRKGAAHAQCAFRAGGASGLDFQLDAARSDDLLDRRYIGSLIVNEDRTVHVADAMVNDRCRTGWSYRTNAVAQP